MATQGKHEIDQRLAESLKELAVGQPLEKITIKDITDRAGVIRPTFYNHFQDKYELLEWIIEMELLRPLLPLFQNGMMTEAIVLLFNNIERDRAFYTRFIRMEGAVTFGDIARRSVKKALLTVLEEHMSGKNPKHRWLTADVVAAYYAQSMCFVTEHWILQGMLYTPQEMAEAYRYMLTHSMEDVLKDL